MVTKTTKISIGLMILLVSVGTIIIMFPSSGISMKFTNEQTEFYVTENNISVLSGIELTSIDDNTDYTISLKRSSSKITNITKVTRTKSYSNGAVLIDVYEFNSNAAAKELIPLKETHTVKNSKGRIFNYIIYNISYDGEYSNIVSPFVFGHNMKLVWEGNPSASIMKDKIVLSYKIQKDSEIFKIRLFDPDTTVPNVTLISPPISSIFSYGINSNFSISANVTDDVNVSYVYINVSYPNGTKIQTQLINYSNNGKYEVNFTSPALIGLYNITFIANDTSNNINSSIKTNFTIIDSINPKLFNFTPNGSVNYIINDTVSIGINATDDINMSTVFVNVTYPNGTVSNIQLIRVGVTQNFNNTLELGTNIGKYIINYFGNDTSNNKNYSINSSFNVSCYLRQNTNITTNVTILNAESIMVSWRINNSLNYLNNATVQIIRPNGTLYAQINIGSPYNGNVSNVTYTYATLAGVENGTWTTKLNIFDNNTVCGNYSKYAYFDVTITNVPSKDLFNLTVSVPYQDMTGYIYSLEFDTMFIENRSIITQFALNTSAYNGVIASDYVVSNYNSPIDYYVRSDLGYPNKIPHAINRTYAIPFIRYNTNSSSTPGFCFQINVTQKMISTGYNISTFNVSNTSYVLNLFDYYGNYIKSIPFRTNNGACS